MRLNRIAVVLACLIAAGPFAVASVAIAPVAIAPVGIAPVGIAPVGIAQVPRPGMADEGPFVRTADEGPFVEHRLVLQISDASDAKQQLILSNAVNVLKAFGPDKVAIEIVAFGPGIELLRDDNPNAARIASLTQQGVRFDACVITIETVERDTGKRFPLNPVARRVDAGVPQIMLLAEHGYVVVRP
jgi:uncharacterized protein